MANITKGDVVSYMQALITQPVNGTRKWATDNNPTGAATSYSPGPLTNYMYAGQVLTYSPGTSEVSGGTVSLAQTCAVLRNAAQVLSRARNVRLIRTSYPYSSYFYDQTVLTHMNSGYQAAIGDFPANPAYGNATVAAINTFVDGLNGVVAAYRNSTLTFVEYYCHSSCHSNHSSRGRR